jgi:hypothetical protein
LEGSETKSKSKGETINAVFIWLEGGLSFFKGVNMVYVIFKAKIRPKVQRNKRAA